MVHSTKRFVLSLGLCYFVLVFFSPFSIAITSLGEERANLSAFRMYVWFVLVWFYLFPLPLRVWDGLRLVIVALSGLFSLLFSWYTYSKTNQRKNSKPSIDTSTQLSCWKWICQYFLENIEYMSVMFLLFIYIWHYPLGRAKVIWIEFSMVSHI